MMGMGTVKRNRNNKGNGSVDCCEFDTLGKIVTTTPEPVTSSTNEVHPSIRGDLVTHQIGDNVKRIHNEFHGFPDDIQEAERGRLHRDSIKSQLGTFIHPPTENRDNSVFKIREFV